MRYYANDNFTSIINLESCIQPEKNASLKIPLQSFVTNKHKLLFISYSELAEMPWIATISYVAEWVRWNEISAHIRAADHSSNELSALLLNPFQIIRRNNHLSVTKLIVCIVMCSRILYSAMYQTCTFVFRDFVRSSIQNEKFYDTNNCGSFIANKYIHIFPLVWAENLF